MAEFQAHIYVIDFILLAFVLEAGGLIGYHALTARGLRPAEVIWNLLSGLMLVLALRLALSEARIEGVVLCLLASFAAHMLDLRSRWQRDEKSKK